MRFPTEERSRAEEAFNLSLPFVVSSPCLKTSILHTATVPLIWTVPLCLVGFGVKCLWIWHCLCIVLHGQGAATRPGENTDCVCVSAAEDLLRRWRLANGSVVLPGWRIIPTDMAILGAAGALPVTELQIVRWQSYQQIMLHWRAIIV